MSDRKICLILCYARSGGTLLNKYLANLRDIVVLSEGHPIHNKKGGIFSIKNQVKKWYGINISSENYIDQINEIKTWCDQNNKYLVIRDWSYIDFTKSFLNNNTPLLVSKNISLFKKNNIEFNKIGFIRDGIDVYLSQDKNIKVFSPQYLSFIKYLKNNNITVFKFEDFLNNAQDQLKKIFKELNIDLKYNGNDINLFKLQKKVIGDTEFSRGNKFNEIKILKRRHVWWFKKPLINSDQNLKKANILFNYSENYESREHETLNENFIYSSRLIYNYLLRILKKIQK
tara:strand:- start:911 stop:1768 length:858 start_codon:yes stop_codon:yes gene_type:complete